MVDPSVLLLLETLQHKLKIKLFKSKTTILSYSEVVAD